jgi:hypothetical protein
MAIKKLRTESGWWNGDEVALATLREFSAFAVARFHFSGPMKSEPLNVGHPKAAGEVAGRNQFNPKKSAKAC